MRPLIIDTDPGVDDAFAIALAARSPEVELRALTTVFGNVPLTRTTENARRLLALCGRPDVPVAVGADRPLAHPHPMRARYAHGADGLSGHADVLPAATVPVHQHGAVALLAELLRDSSEPVTIAAIGPLTNIALLLAAYPELTPKIDRLVIMGGGLDGGNTTASAEFNIWSDPEAARRVLVEEAVPTVLVPLELTTACAVSGDWLDSLPAAGAIGTALHALIPDYRAYYQTALGRDGMVVHDVLAVAEAIRPGTLDCESLPIEVECGFGPGRGATLADRRRTELGEITPGERSREVLVAIDADRDELHRYLLAGLTG
ncbi:pyrimidine-specific ribonucleoside hydrolase [Tamaricihabitans halophyticus]|uniref:Pyrimidine-specific ribonucleoside hydrolase n=1 Tax=Tamaricihabitans halophyticus TaxID=1262583 RepID=A0A4R2QH91_9PSEU|nr:nucleoside hydrolase [Tamaricihabitans halophyticus]TCP48630.1 pyrimidine-specific ribonucleoside hydrolase [Tamaricihabitans halophyticus]